MTDLPLQETDRNDVHRPDRVRTRTRPVRLRRPECSGIGVLYFGTGDRPFDPGGSGSLGPAGSRVSDATPAGCPPRPRHPPSSTPACFERIRLGKPETQLALDRAAHETLDPQKIGELVVDRAPGWRRPPAPCLAPTTTAARAGGGA